MSFPLTAFQLQCLPIVRSLVVDKPWLPASYVFAHVTIESGWESAVVSSDGLGSIGLMQVLPSTASEFNGGNQADPANSLKTGVAFLSWGRAYLMGRWGFKSSILYHPVCEGYNEGYGAVAEGRADSRYWLKWCAAQEGWAFLDMPQGASGI